MMNVPVQVPLLRLLLLISLCEFTTNTLWGITSFGETTAEVRESILDDCDWSWSDRRQMVGLSEHMRLSHHQ